MLYRMSGWGLLAQEYTQKHAVIPPSPAEPASVWEGYPAGDVRFGSAHVAPW